MTFRDAAWMEKTMSKTTTHNSEAHLEVRELSGAELEKVAGGWPGSNWAWGTTTSGSGYTGITGESMGLRHDEYFI
jgi:hypothetical protein